MQQECDTDCTACSAKGCCIDIFRKILREHGGRLTQERTELLRLICDKKGHFHPQELAGELQNRGVGMSLSTLYRNLPLLVQAGIIRRACVEEELSGGGTTYEHVWGHAHHDHLVCSRCGTRVEFSYPAIDILQEAVARDHGFQLERHHLELVGVCPNCQKH